MNPALLPIPVILTRCLSADADDLILGFGIGDTFVAVINAQGQPASGEDEPAGIVAKGDSVINWTRQPAARAVFETALNALSPFSSRAVLLVHPGGGEGFEILGSDFDNLSDYFGEPARSTWTQLTEGPRAEFSTGGGAPERLQLGRFIREWANCLRRKDPDAAQQHFERLRRAVASAIVAGTCRDFAREIASGLDAGVKQAAVVTFSSAMHDSLGPLTRLLLQFQMWEEADQGDEGTGSEEIVAGLQLWSRTRRSLEEKLKPTINADRWGQFDRTLREKYDNDDTAVGFERLLNCAARREFEKARLSGVNEAAVRRWTRELLAALEQYRP